MSGHTSDPPKGHMAAQQTGPPTPLSPDSKSAPAASGAILAPPTPVLSAKKDVYELYGGSNYSERRPDPAMPFFAEPSIWTEKVLA